jgi:hypothetical protein
MGAKWNKIPRTEFVGVRLTPNERRRLENAAKSDQLEQLNRYGLVASQTTASDILRTALDQYLRSARMC